VSQQVWNDKDASVLKEPEGESLIFASNGDVPIQMKDF
jgi:hypothetical protein